MAITIFNYKNKTKIYSLQASLKANYVGKNGVEKGTFIADNVSLGYMTYVNSNSWLENCSIGNYCSISSNVMICPAEHYTDRFLSHPIVGCWRTDRVSIGHDVLISHGVTILQGVSIGNGAVIAAGAVVTKDIAPYSVVGGVPAKIIRMRFDKTTIEKIEHSELYFKSEDEVKKLVKEFYL